MPNHYPERFVQLLDLLPADQRALDAGAGGRSHPQVVPIDIIDSPYNPLRASVLDLPFPDNTFGLVLSQAVLEHVTDPQRAVDEMVRVLAPGGLLYVEAAAWQPIHMPPDHYFNITPFGLRHLCRHLDIVDGGTLGYLSDLWEWISRELELSKVLGRRAVARQVAELRRVDNEGDPDVRSRFCSGVWLTGAKR